jgi:putative flippase GtrA
MNSYYFGRYAGSGVLNTVAGFFIIFLIIGLSTSPIVANVADNIAGLVLGFLLTKKIVFRSEGNFTSEGFRYLCVFFTSFMLNLLTLRIVL